MADLFSGLKNAAWLASRQNQVTNIKNIGSVGNLSGKIGLLGELTALPSAVAGAWNGAQGLYEIGEGILKRRPTIETVRRSDTPGYQPTGPIGVGSIPAKDKTGEFYRDQELRLSAAARAKVGPSAGGGIGGGNMASYVPNPQSSPAAERAYRQQLSSTAQQVAQDPQLDAWSKQRALDVASKDYSKSEDMGMRIWAEKHGKLAKQVKPGQAGYDVIQQVLHGTSQQPAAQPNYTNSFSAMPDLRAYSNSMPNAIVRAPGDMPTFAIDDPRFGDYNSTTNQTYNLVNSLASRTTEGTLSLPWGEINRIGGSSEAGGIYPGAPLKLPVPPTQFGAPGYPTLTADTLLPIVDIGKTFTANGMDSKFKAFANAMYKNN